MHVRDPVVSDFGFGCRFAPLFLWRFVLWICMLGRGKGYGSFFVHDRLSVELEVGDGECVVLCGGCVTVQV